MKEFILKHRLALIVAGVVAIVIGSCIGSGGSGEEEGDVPRRFGKGQKVMRTPQKHQKAKKSERAYRSDEKHRRAEVKLLDEDTGEVDNGQYDEFRGHDREIARVMDTAFWDDDMTNTLAAAMEAAGSKNSELRAKAVEMAAWYGKDGMETLMLFMADPDEEIAESARDAWVEGLRDIDNDEDRAALVAPLSKVLTDPDTINGMLMSLNDLPNIAQMQVLIDIMDTGTEEAYEVALDHYSFVTGEDFTTVEAAQAWLDANWEEEENDRLDEIANSAETDIDEAVEEAGMDKEKVLQLMTDEAAELGMTEEEYFNALDKKAEENGVSRAEYIYEMFKDNPDLQAQKEQPQEEAAGQEQDGGQDNDNEDANEDDSDDNADSDEQTE